MSLGGRRALAQAMGHEPWAVARLELRLRKLLGCGYDVIEL